MSTMKWLKWFCVGLLAVGCAVAMSACGGGDDGDDEGGGTTVVVTNVVGGTTVVVTNVVVPAALVAPQLITPVDDQIFTTIIVFEPGYSVDFEWTGVPGATSYMIEVDGDQTAVAGTTITLPLDLGDHEWRVWAKDANGAGPASAKNSFKIQIQLLVPFPSP